MIRNIVFSSEYIFPTQDLPRSDLLTQKIFPLSECSIATQNNYASSPKSQMSISYIASLLKVRNHLYYTTSSLKSL